MQQPIDPAGHAAVHASSADDPGGRGEHLPINPAIESFTRWLALAGGLMTLAAITATLVSVVGRYGFGAPVPGDYELVELLCAVGVFLFFPYAHATGSNIVVELFTAPLPARARRALDLVHDVIFAGVAALLAWRLGIGLAEKFQSGESTMLIRIPFWWSYSLAVSAMVVLCIVCFARVVAGFKALRS